MRSKIFIIAICLCLPFMACMPNIAGGSTETTNPAVIGVLYQPDGKTPAKGARVYLLPVDHNPRQELLKVLAAIPDSTTTNDSGVYKLDFMSDGIYNVFASKDGNLAFQDSIVVKADTQTRVPADTLKAPGGIRGRVRLQQADDARTVFLMFMGTSTWSAPDDSTGIFGVSNMAEGTYRVRILTTLDTYLPKDTVLSVIAGRIDTLAHDIILQYTGIPTPKNVAITYDTLRQIVTLSWSKADDTTLVKSYNIYRRNIDSNIMPERINALPVADTVFRDSTGVQDQTYEYRVAALDSNATESVRSAAIQVRIALYDIVAKNIRLAYDTLTQSVTLRWSNPDTALVMSFNVYRKLPDSTAEFSIINASPIQDTVFRDSSGERDQTYEYCVAAIIKNGREGIKSESLSVHIALFDIPPKNVRASLDTLNRIVKLSWSNPDTGRIKRFNVYRKNVNDNYYKKLNNYPFEDSVYFDSTGQQDSTYEYHIAGIVDEIREGKWSEGVVVGIAPCFEMETAFENPGTGPGQLLEPSDIAVSANGDIYIVDKGNGCIKVFDSILTYKKQFGKGILSSPGRIALNEQGKIFVSNGDSTILVFDTTETVVDTLTDTIIRRRGVVDLCAKNGSLYVICGDSLLICSYEGARKTVWKCATGDYSLNRVEIGDSNKILIGQGRRFPELWVFDSSGNFISKVNCHYFPTDIAFDQNKQRLYIVGIAEFPSGLLSVMDGAYKEVANVKFSVNNGSQEAAVGFQKDGSLLLVLRYANRILKFKPRF